MEEPQHLPSAPASLRAVLEHLVDTVIAMIDRLGNVLAVRPIEVRVERQRRNPR